MAFRRGLQERIVAHAPPSADVRRTRSLSDILESDNTYQPDPIVTVRPFDFERVQVTKPGHATQPLIPFLDGDALQYATDPRRILNPDSDVDRSEVPKLYTDPALEDRGTLLKLALSDPILPCPILS